MSDPTQLHLFIDAIALFVLAIAIIFATFFFFFYYLRRNSKLREEIESLKKQTEYGHKLFDDHFRITDQTIVDLRNDKASLIRENQKLVKELEMAMEKIKKLSKTVPKV